MSDQKTYFQADILNRPLQKHGLLEEFNLPPKAIAFIRHYRRHIVAALCGVAVIIVGWSSWQQYRHKLDDRAAGRFAEAVAVVDPQKRQTMLEELLKEFGGTGSAVWARLELGHLAVEAGRFDEALARYQEVLAGLSGTSPIRPLAQLAVAQTLEGKGSQNEALAAYQKLVETKGFAWEAYLAMARIHERQGAMKEAREMYNRVLPLEEVPAPIKEQVKDRLARL
ncbi:MAG: YfgM family protein [Thermodesulfobacteriota bacterium]